MGGGDERVEFSYILDEENFFLVFIEGGFFSVDFSSLDINVELFEEEEECSGLFGCFLLGIGDVFSGIVEGIISFLGLE